MKRIFKALSITTCLAVFACSPLMADATDEPMPQAEPQMNFWPAVGQGVHDSFDRFCGHCPEWMKELDLTIVGADSQKPVWSLSMLHPFHKRGERNEYIWSWQAGWNFHNNNNQYNLGLVYRYLRSDMKWFWGVNAFWDHSVRLGHDRLSLGAELVGRYFTLGANYYNTITDREYYATVGANTMHEKSVDGYDISLSAPVPYLPWLRVYGNRQIWEAASQNVKNRRVNLVSAQASITPRLHVEVGSLDDNFSRSSAYARVVLNLGHMVREIEHTLFNTRVNPSQAFTARDVSKHLDRKVDRESIVYVERVTYNSSNALVGDGTIDRGM